MNYKKLEDMIGIEFKDKGLLKLAFTHRSYNNDKENSYERLELLGDRILGLVIVEDLFFKQPQLSEGEISKKMNQKSCGEALFTVYKGLRLSEFVIMSKGEKNEGGADKKSIGSAVVEALIGAIYLEQSLAGAKEFILTNWSKYIDGNEDWQTDDKSDIQAYVQSLGYSPPVYKIINKTGPDHNPKIEISASVCAADGEKIACIYSVGCSRREAEKIAARKLIEYFKG